MTRADLKVSGLLILITAWAAACSIEDASLTTVDFLAPRAEACGACHVEIYEEWKNSRHARAYIGEAFREQTFDYRMSICLPCHIPETVFTRELPVRARDFYQEEGVTCIACHLVEGEHHGPFFAASFTPHATRSDPELYLNAAFCGTCHRGTYRSFALSQIDGDDAKTCQSCHMGSVRRKITQGTGFLSNIIVAMHDEYDLRRHTFDAAVLPGDEAVELEVLASAPDQAAAQDAPAISLRIRNLLPHSIPTGDYGFRKVQLVAEWTGEGAEAGSRLVRDFYKDLDTALNAGETLNLLLPSPPGNLRDKRLRVILKRVNQDGSDAFIITDETLAAPVETAVEIRES